MLTCFSLFAGVDEFKSILADVQAKVVSDPAAYATSVSKFVKNYKALQSESALVYALSCFGKTTVFHRKGLKGKERKGNWSFTAHQHK
jgi:hypothetical protein